MDVHLSGLHPDHAVVAVAGDLDLATSNELLRSLRRFLHVRTRGIRLDLSGVTFMNSAGLRPLLTMAQCAKDLDRTIQLAAKSPAVDRVLELAGLPPGSSYLAATAPTRSADHTGEIPRMFGACAARHRVPAGPNRGRPVCGSRIAPVADSSLTCTYRRP